MIRMLLATLVATSFTAVAQLPSKPAFDVASVKPVAPPFPSGGGPWIVNHGRFRAEVAAARSVIAWAYDVLNPQVRGGALWVDRELYRFEAKAEDPEAGPDQIKAMMQTLLEDRFKLVVHRQTQEGQIYTLITAKNGPKMEEAKDARTNFIHWAGPGSVTFTAGNLLGLINVLSSILEAPVVDKTGLKGFYNFTLEFENPRFQRPPTGSQLPVDSAPNILTAVQEQLGLKLEAAKGPIEVLVIDHIERPTEN